MINEELNIEEFVAFLLEHHTEDEVLAFLENDFEQWLEENSLDEYLAEGKSKAAPVKAKTTVKKPTGTKPKTNPPAKKKSAAAKKPAAKKAAPKKKSAVAELVKKAATKKSDAPKKAKTTAKKPKDKSSTKKTTIALSIERSNTKTTKPKSQKSSAKKSSKKKGFLGRLMDKFHGKKEMSARAKKAKQTRDLRQTFGVAPGKAYKNKPIPKGSKRETTLVKSEFEPNGNMISEITKRTLGRYISTAAHDVADKASWIGFDSGRAAKPHTPSGPFSEVAPKDNKKLDNRLIGIRKASDRLRGVYFPKKKIQKYTAEETEVDESFKVKLGQRFTTRSFKQAKEAAMTKHNDRKALKTVTRPSGQAQKAHITQPDAVDDNKRGDHMLKGQYPWGTVSNVLAKAALAKLKNIPKPADRLHAMNKIWGSQEHFHSLIKRGVVGRGADDAPVRPKVSLPKITGIDDGKD